MHADNDKEDKNGTDNQYGTTHDDDCNSIESTGSMNNSDAGLNGGTAEVP